MKKVLITGANGFAASYLKRLFKSDNVVLTDIAGTGLIRCDISDREMTLKMIGKTLPDEVYHLGAISSPQVTDESLVEKVNVVGTLNLLEGIKKFVPSAKVLLVSSGYVYGDCKKPATEETEPHPTGAYAESKLKMEQEALKNFPDLQIFIARPFAHSGKGQRPGLFFPDMSHKIFEAKKHTNPEIIVYNPQTKRDFTHVKDVVEAYKLIIEKGIVSEIYNICLGKSYLIRDLVEKMAKQYGLSNYKVRNIKKGKAIDIIGDNLKIKQLGWRPKYDVSQIIKDFRRP